ncbi:MAG: hypothetical protein LBK95_16390, partial [Bifidobacteriaceae bacterium]|nr:hypothetical protein [Bifidobacteriaceae bacterium]
FTPGPEGAAEDGRRIVKFAEQNGWVVTNVSDQRGRFSVRLSKPHGEDKLSGQVTGDDDPSSGAPQVHVHLLG